MYSLGSQTVTLEDGKWSVSIDQVVAPFTLTVDPFGYKPPYKVRKIEYVWGDGTTDVIEYQPNPSLNLNKLSLGDPLNFPKTKTYQIKDQFVSEYNAKIIFYFFGTKETTTFEIFLTLITPDLDFGINRIFEEFHLVKTKMFGVDNTIVYTFQGINKDLGQDYLLMSTTNWKKIPVIQLQNSVHSNVEIPYGYTGQLPYNINNVKGIPQPTPSLAILKDIQPTIGLPPTPTVTPTPSVTPTPPPTPSYTPTPTVTPTLR